MGRPRVADRAFAMVVLPVPGIGASPCSPGTKKGSMLDYADGSAGIGKARENLVEERLSNFCSDGLHVKGKAFVVVILYQLPYALPVRIREEALVYKLLYVAHHIRRLDNVGYHLAFHSFSLREWDVTDNILRFHRVTV